MKILFIGDVVGKPGRRAVAEILPSLKKERGIDLVMANAENLAHGRGFTVDTIKELQSYGVDFFTSGNHIWDNKNDMAKLDDKSFPLLRPANFADDVPGRGFQIIETAMMKRVLVINLMGRVFMKHYLDCPFRKFDQILKLVAGEDLQAIFVDFHAEASSEKVAMAFHIDGRASALVGTHTHVPTADQRIFKEGTGYVTDVGMTGPLDSVIGMNKNNVLRNFLTQLPYPFEVEEQGALSFNAIEIEVDEKTQKTLNIERVDRIIN